MTRRDVLFISLVCLGLFALGGTLFRSNARPGRQAADLAVAPSVRAASREIDRLFANHWSKLKLRPAQRAGELEVARRLSLALTGTVPSIEEIRELERVSEEDRRDWWVSHLLADRRTSDYLAERFARAFVGVEDGPFLLYRRRRFVMWLSEQLAANRPYDVLVRELITNTGLWTDAPSVNFFTVTFDDAKDGLDVTRLAGRVSRAFLGMRIDCLQCHNDQLGNVVMGTPQQRRNGTQQDFHQLAAFFGQTEASFFGVREVADGERQYEYKYLEADEENVIPPSVPFQPELMPTQGPRRERLAGWITHPDNRAFARAAVNRTWAILFGRPLAQPIDDIPLFEDPATGRVFPPALEFLADDFVEHGYDLRRLIRVIARSSVFQVSSKADFEVHPEHEEQWAVFPLTRLRPEQVAGSIIQACSIQTIDAESSIFAKLARFFEQDDFIRRYGDMGQDEFDERGGTVTQRLLMMNGKLVKERTNQKLVQNAATQIAAVTDSPTKAVEATYLAVLARRPTPREAQHFQDHLAELKASRRVDYIEDLFWILLNSTEFSWNH